MKRITIAILLITTIAAAAVAAPRSGPPPMNAQGPRPGGPGEMPPALLADFLDLTEAQSAQVQQFRETLRATTEPLHESMRANRQQLEAAAAAGDAARAGALAVANHQLAQQIKAARDAYKTSFESVLTAEQKAKFAVYQELMELRRDRGPKED